MLTDHVQKKYVLSTHRKNIFIIWFIELRAISIWSIVRSMQFSTVSTVHMELSKK